jgi:lysophospholipase L1-like esterase
MPEFEPPHRDDNLMERFDRWSARRFRARDAVLAIAIAATLLVVAAGPSVRHAGEELNPGIERDLVLIVGRPAAWLADRLPVHTAAHTLTAWLSPDQHLGGAGGFRSVALRTAIPGSYPITPDAFDPVSIGAPPPPRRALHTLLVTGDSMAQPLDLHLARSLAPAGVRVIRDPHIGTGISKSILVDWGSLAHVQVAHDRPDVVVVFIGANDGFSMPGPAGRSVGCCGADWAAIYAQRARQMMDTYRQAGAARVYWLTLPAPRDPARARIAHVVNAAIEVAAEPWRDEVRVLDMVPVFTPGWAYRDSMTVGGKPSIVRESDGIHLNDAGSAVAAQLVLTAVGSDFTCSACRSR